MKGSMGWFKGAVANIADSFASTFSSDVSLPLHA